MPESTTRELFNRYWEAFTAKKTGEVASLYIRDSYFEDVALKYVGHGPDQVRAYLDTCNRAIPEWSAERHDLAVDGDGFAYNYTFRGRLDGTLGPLTGNGHEFSLRFGAIAEVRNGSIVKHRLYWNLAGLLYELGERTVPLIVPGAPLSPVE